MKRSAPDAREVAKRSIALKHLCAFVLDVPPRPLVAQWLQDWDEADIQDFELTPTDT